MALADYRKKRNFSRTSEPKGSHRRSSKSCRFVVQKHSATRLHYDFRLELDGVLKSWAVPKGPSLDPTQRRLAVEVEDHPVEYASFEGAIPENQYGGGTVIVWDEGTWVPSENPRYDLHRGSLKFELKGKKLRGRWALFRMKRRPKDKANNWLLVKENDRYSQSLSKGDILEQKPKSIVSGRRLEELSQPGARP